jgi:hypothetical protein
VPFVGAGVGIEHDDAVIEISVGYVDFVRFRVDFRIGWTAKTRHVVAVGLLSRFADLQHKFPIAATLRLCNMQAMPHVDAGRSATLRLCNMLSLGPRPQGRACKHLPG